VFSARDARVVCGAEEAARVLEPCGGHACMERRSGETAAPRMHAQFRRTRRTPIPAALQQESGVTARHRRRRRRGKLRAVKNGTAAPLNAGKPRRELVRSGAHRFVCAA